MTTSAVRSSSLSVPRVLRSAVRRSPLTSGISRKLAAFHLDKLTEKGLLIHHYARLPGKGGPGAGRPAKVYEPSRRSIEISVPERQYELAGRLLLEGVANQIRGWVGPGVHQRRCSGRGTAGGAPGRLRPRPAPPGPRAHPGRRPGGARRTVDSSRSGNRPRSWPCATARFTGWLELSPDVVCGMNRSFIEGIVRGLGNDSVKVILDPEQGQCCVKLCSPGSGAGSQ